MLLYFGFRTQVVLQNFCALYKWYNQDQNAFIVILSTVNNLTMLGTNCSGFGSIYKSNYWKDSGASVACCMNRTRINNQYYVLLYTNTHIHCLKFWATWSMKSWISMSTLQYMEGMVQYTYWTLESSNSFLS